MDIDWPVVGVLCLMALVPILFVAWILQYVANRRRVKRRATEPWQAPPELSGPLPRRARLKLGTYLLPASIPFGATAIFYWLLLSHQAPWLSGVGFFAIAGPFWCALVVRVTREQMKGEKTLLQWGSITKGTVIGRRAATYPSGMFRLDVEFYPTPSARKVTSHSRPTGEWLESLRPGDSVSVLYDPQNPAKSALYPCERWKVRS